MVGRLKANCTSLQEAPYVMFSQSSLTPIDTRIVRVEQRVTWRAGKDPNRQATLSFSLTHVGAQRLLPGESS